MPEELRRAGEVASMLNVHVNTVRLWTNEFVAYMEAGVQVPAKETRLYSDRDVNLLRLVASERERKRSIADIKAMIDAMVPADRTAVTVDAIQPIQPPTVATTGAELPALVSEAMQAQMASLRAEIIEDVRRLLEQQQPARARHLTNTQQLVLVLAYFAALAAMVFAGVYWGG